MSSKKRVKTSNIIFCILTALLLGVLVYILIIGQELTSTERILAIAAIAALAALLIAGVRKLFHRRHHHHHHHHSGSGQHSSEGTHHSSSSKK